VKQCAAELPPPRLSTHCTKMVIAAPMAVQIGRAPSRSTQGHPRSRTHNSPSVNLAAPRCPHESCGVYLSSTAAISRMSSRYRRAGGTRKSSRAGDRLRTSQIARLSRGDPHLEHHPAEPVADSAQSLFGHLPAPSPESSRPAIAAMTGLPPHRGAVSDRLGATDADSAACASVVTSAHDANGGPDGGQTPPRPA